MKTGRMFLLLAGMLFAFGAHAADITIGTGTNAVFYPLSTSHYIARTQVLYLASEIGAAKKLYSLALDVGKIPGQTMNEFTIRLKHTDLSDFGSSPVWESSGWTTVYQDSQTISAVGWNTFIFTTPFLYNGTQNLMVDISFNNSSSTSDGFCRRTLVNDYRSMYYRINFASPLHPLTWAGSTPPAAREQSFLNIKLGYSMVTVPSIVGMEQTAAQTALVSAELLSGNVSYVFSNTVAAGNVISQSPAAGQSVFTGSPINYVVSAGVKYSGGGTAANPYLITNKWNLLGIGSTTDYNKYFILTTDIDLEDQTYTAAIIPPFKVPVGTAAFTGTFDGNHHCVKNFTITAPSTDYVGFFSCVESGGLIKNLGVENANILGRSHVGGLAGYMIGTLSNCHSTGSVWSSNAQPTGLLMRVVSLAGGLAGYGAGALTNCYSTCSVSSSALTPSASNELYSCAGGLVGESYCAFNNCYSTGSVTLYVYSLSSFSSYSYTGGLAGMQGSNTITNCYSTGTVTASGNISVYKGGLVGSASSVVNSFWDTQTSGMATSAGGTGKTTVEMKTLSTFTSAGWDFASVWAICEGTHYPRFQWQIPAGDFACPDGVNMEDLEYLAARWLLDTCTADNDYCQGADMNSSGKVDLADWMTFAANWLEI